jgi:hypothetical protein
LMTKKIKAAMASVTIGTMSRFIMSFVTPDDA